MVVLPLLLSLSVAATIFQRRNFPLHRIFPRSLAKKVHQSTLRNYQDCHQQYHLSTCRKPLSTCSQRQNELLIQNLCEKMELDQAVDVLMRIDTPASTGTYKLLLKTCNKRNGLSQAKRVQEHVETHQRQFDGEIGNYLTVTLAKCGDIENACRIFFKLPYHTVYSCTAIISAYVESGLPWEALEIYQHMQNEGIKPDKVTYASLLKACSDARDLNQGRIVHAEACEKDRLSDIFVINALVAMYGKCGAIADAEDAFSRLRYVDVFSCNAMLSAYTERGESMKALLLYRQMLNDGMTPDKYTVVIALRACAILANNLEPDFLRDLSSKSMILEIGTAFEADVKAMGLAHDVFVGTALVSLYGKLGVICEAEAAFSVVSEWDIIAWNALLSAYIDQCDAIKALQLYAHLQKERVYGDQLTLILAIKAVSILITGKEVTRNISGQITKRICLEIGRSLHLDGGHEPFTSNVYVGNTLVAMYAKCGAILEAIDSFSMICERDIVSWNVMLSAFVEQGEWEKSLLLYRQVHHEGLIPDQCMFISAIQACSILSDADDICCITKGCAADIALEIGQALHADVRRKPFARDVSLNTTLCSMYGECGAIRKAEHIMNGLLHCDTISWNAMLSAYVDHGRGEKALQFFKQMIAEGMVPNQLTFVYAFQACCLLPGKENFDIQIEPCCLNIGKALHVDAGRMGYASDAIVGTAVLTMYGKCGSVVDAETVFRDLSHKDVISWNAMLSVLAGVNQGEKLLHLYKEMLNLGLIANDITMICVLQACSEIGNLELCKHIHFYIEAVQLNGTVPIAATLIQAYGSCASMEDTMALFDSVARPDYVLWTAYISGFAGEADFVSCKCIFDNVKLVGITPDKVMFTSVLSACSHSGQFLEAVEYFMSMTKDHRLTHDLKHYSIILELLGRAGDFKRMDNFLAKLPMEADVTIWLGVLGACHTHGNLELAKWAFHHVLHLQPPQATAFVMIANIFEEVRLEKRALMTEASLRQTANNCECFIETINSIEGTALACRTMPFCRVSGIKGCNHVSTESSSGKTTSVTVHST